MSILSTIEFYDREADFFQVTQVVTDKEKMFNGIWSLNTFKNLFISDLLRIAVQTCEGDLNWGFR